MRDFDDLNKNSSELTGLVSELTSKFKHFKDFYDHSPIMFASIHPKNFTIIECNETFMSMLGKEAKPDIIGHSILEYCHEDSYLEAKTLLKEFSNFENLVSKKLFLKYSNGSKLPVLLKLTPVTEENGSQVTYGRCSFTDLTQVHEMQSLLQESELMFRVMSELNTDGWWDLDLKNSTSQYLSPGFKKLFGYEDHEIANNVNWWNANIYPDDKTVALQALEDHLTSGKPYNITIRFKHKNGSYVWVICRGIALKNLEGKNERMIGTLTDISALKETERALLRASKFASLGEMAGGIAHEINNPLAIINSYTECLKIAIEEGMDKQSLLKNLDKISATVNRIHKIVKGLRAISRDAENDPMIKATIDEVMNSSLELCKEKLKFNQVDLKVNYPKDLVLFCRPTQLSQVILNLVNNSMDAISELKEKWIHIDTIKCNSHIRISITDSGTGLESADAESIFQPFFTTKGLNKGTGLGLSISQSIIQQHNGSITIDKQSKNTTFVIELPIVSDEKQLAS